MKKKKKKLDIKQLALEHVEKAVLGVALLIFFGFVYSFFGHPSLPANKGPAELSAKADEAVKHMAIATWDAERAEKAGIVVTDYVKRSKRELLAAEDYVLPVPFDRPIKESKRKRSQPKLFAIEQLRVATGLGPFSVTPPVAAAEGAKKDTKKKPGAVPEAPMAPPPRNAPGAAAAGTLEGRHWVMITGLVPMKKQIAAFDEAFKDTIPVEGGGAGEKLRDNTPQYRRFTIERAEVTDGQEGKFEPMNLIPTANFFKRWSGRAPEVVSLDYVDSYYTMPLAPRHDGDWGEEAAHPKEIPLATEEELEKQKAQEQAMEEANKAKEAADADNPFGANAEAATNKTSPVDRRPVKTGPETKPKKDLEYRLFRFTDFTVEPGKSYRYRAKLQVKNPNFQLLDKYLKADVDKKSEFLETPISAPSPPATIRTGEGVLVAAPKPSKSDVTANLTVFTIEPETGLKTSTEMQVFRGTVVNLEKEIELATGTKGVAFNTNTVVLDIRGGRPLPGRDKSLLEPSEVLLWNTTTKKLDAHNELDDLEAIKELEAPPPPKVGRGGFPGGGFPGPGMPGPGMPGAGMPGGGFPGAEVPGQQKGTKASKTGKPARGGGSILDGPVAAPPASGKTPAKKPTRATP